MIFDEYAKIIFEISNNWLSALCFEKYFIDEKSTKTTISIEYPEAFELGKNERYYPISNDNNNNLYNKYLEEAKKIDNLYLLGRLGDYKYYNMDNAVENAFNLFKKVFN